MQNIDLPSRKYQDEINQSEWDNPENWSGPGWREFYFSKKDSRTWVPKSIPALGWTVNLAKSAGAGLMLCFLIGLPLLMLWLGILMTTHAKR
jgi:uncharacterized membrane protein